MDFGGISCADRPIYKKKVIYVKSKSQQGQQYLRKLRMDLENKIVCQ